MILDHISKKEQYAATSAKLMRALDAARSYATDPYKTGRTELEEGLALLAFEYDTKPLNEDSLMEAHRKNVDIMYMVEGEETIYVKPTDQLTAITMEYDESKDALLAKVDDDVTAVRLTAGQFVVLYPQDAHCPGCVVGDCHHVKKIICKMAVE